MVLLMVVNVANVRLVRQHRRSATSRKFILLSLVNSNDKNYNRTESVHVVGISDPEFLT